MAWNWPTRKERSAVEWSGFLERGVKVEGRLETTGTFRIDAEMKGHLVSEDTLIIGEHAAIEGQITGNEVLVAGRCDGIIRGKARVELQRNAIVAGEVLRHSYHDHSRWCRCPLRQCWRCRWRCC